MITGRTYQVLTGLVLIALLFSAGIPGSAGGAAVKPSEAAQYHEAPMLAALVAAGQLPPVGERLPPDPVVITPTQSIGRYGGTWHDVSGGYDLGNILLSMYDPPIRWKDDYSGYEPGLAEGYEWSTSGFTFALHLRAGIQWSDGITYTTADWRFWWEDMATDPANPYASLPGWLRKSDGSPVDMIFPDDFTVVWSSDRPQWVLPFYMAQGFWEFANGMMKPAHYLEQFHPKYNPSATYNDLAAADQWWENPDFPTVLAWHCSSVITDVVTFERNPYYWKVDTQNNQLPYIDHLQVEIVPDEAERLARAAQGDYDAAFRESGSPLDIPYLEANAAAHGYHLQAGWMNGAGAWPGYLVNQDYVAGGGNYPDDTPEHAAQIRTLFRDKRFRKALSIGFNRQDVIDAAWNGNGTPTQATISPQSLHFAGVQGQLVYQQWAAADAQLDLTQANQWLDQIGMTDVNTDTWRELPGGITFTLRIDVTDWGGSYAVQRDAAEEMRNQWMKNLAIRVEINDLQNNPNEADNRVSQGYYMLRAGNIAELDIWTYPDWIFPVNNQYMFPLEGLWYATGGTQGMPPDPGSPAEQLQALYNQGLVEPDFADRQQFVWDAIQIHIDDGPFVIGVSGDQPMPVVIKNNFHNVPEYGVLGPWAPASPGNMHPEQFWIDLGVYLPIITR